MIEKAAKIKILISVPGKDLKGRTREVKAQKAIDLVGKVSHTYLQVMNKLMAKHRELRGVVLVWR